MTPKPAVGAGAAFFYARPYPSPEVTPAPAGLAERIGLQPNTSRAVAAQLDAVTQREARDGASQVALATQREHPTMVQGERE